LLLTGSTMLALAQRLRVVPKRLGLPKLSLRRGAAPVATGDQAWLFTGCVMDAWQRDTHRNTATVLSAVGVTYQLPGAGGGCCGALHVHAGLADEAKALAGRVIASMPGAAPIVVNSAGCGAALKDYGHLLGTDQALAFSARVRDASEFVAPLVDRLTVRRRLGLVTVQDPCHLRHVQKAHLPVRTVLAAVADVVELDDDGLCCGAGGAYSTLQPELAGQVRQRKVAAIDRAGPQVVASANPGCAYHLAAAGVNVKHPMDLVAEAL
jgi:glycolate oxidase iron-sulfur subunit